MKKNRFFSLWFPAAVTVMLLLFPAAAFAGTWQQTGGRWWYQENDGSYPIAGIYEIDGNTYIFDYDGYMLSDTWCQSPITGKWYYCTGSGALAVNQWAGDYYLGGDGAMVKDTWVGDYYVGSDGAYVPGKTRDSGSQYGGSSGAQYRSGASSSFTPGWIYGYYENVGQIGFSDTHCVQMMVNYDEENGSDAAFYFSIYDQAGNNYSLYNSYDPAGDILTGYYLGNASASMRSRISGRNYKVTYDGWDTIRIYWRDTSWLSSTDHMIELKKVLEYYHDSAVPYSVTDAASDYDAGDSNGTGPFADREYNITNSSSDYRSGSYYDVVNDLETADISRPRQ